ncbi:hypothetical protein KKG41_05170 [Patescibacteria group bacterium]|nr:hypothetical protein [Patescibacteria group bacterium]
MKKKAWMVLITLSLTVSGLAVAENTYRFTDVTKLVDNPAVASLRCVAWHPSGAAFVVAVNHLEIWFGNLNTLNYTKLIGPEDMVGLMGPEDLGGSRRISN